MEREIEGDDRVTEVDKTTPELAVLFADDSIELRPSFLTGIVTRLLNREPQKIFHAAHSFSASPLTIGEVDPLLHKTVYGEVPPVGLTVSIPLFPPKHET